MKPSKVYKRNVLNEIRKRKYSIQAEDMSENRHLIDKGITICNYTENVMRVCRIICGHEARFFW